MNESLYHLPNAHDEPDLFQAALTYTERESGFNARLIEKDYYCSLALQYVYARRMPIVFKGGTCLSKVYLDFYRLSEDLDFIIPIPSDSSRAERREAIQELKQMLPDIEADIPSLRLADPLTGHNQSTQYLATIEYDSIGSGRPEQIKIEIGMREDALRPTRWQPTHTLLVSGLTRRPVVPDFDVHALDIEEAFAEKCRAAMTRRQPAIRDFFDLQCGQTTRQLDLLDPQFIIMVRQKLDVPGNREVDMSPQRKETLTKQLDTDLKPVLRAADFEAFQLDTAFERVEQLAAALATK